MAGFANDSNLKEIMVADNVDFTGGTNATGMFTANGQLLIGSTTAPNIRIGTLTQGTGISVTNGGGSISIGFSSGSGTTGQVLQANTGSNPTWSTATYPATTTINQVLYSSSANVISGIATANNGVHITGTTGIPSVRIVTGKQIGRAHV